MWMCMTLSIIERRYLCSRDFHSVWGPARFKWAFFDIYKNFFLHHWFSGGCVSHFLCLNSFIPKLYWQYTCIKLLAKSCSEIYRYIFADSYVCMFFRICIGFRIEPSKNIPSPWLVCDIATARLSLFNKTYRMWRLCKMTLAILQYWCELYMLYMYLRPKNGPIGFEFDTPISVCNKITLAALQ